MLAMCSLLLSAGPLLLVFGCGDDEATTGDRRLAAG